MKRLYLGAALLGAVVPYLFYFRHLAASGSSLTAFAAAVSANPAASGFTADLLIASLVFWAFMWHRHRLSHGPHPLGFMALNLLVGLACALPAYLYAMEFGRRPRAGRA